MIILLKPANHQVLLHAKIGIWPLKVTYHRNFRGFLSSCRKIVQQKEVVRLTKRGIAIRLDLLMTIFTFIVHNQLMLLLTHGL